MAVEFACATGLPRFVHAYRANSKHEVNMEFGATTLIAITLEITWNVENRRKPLGILRLL